MRPLGNVDRQVAIDRHLILLDGLETVLEALDPEVLAEAAPHFGIATHPL